MSMEELDIYREAMLTPEKSLKRGVKISDPNIHYFTSEKISLSSDDICKIEADGEYVGMGETSFEIIPNSLKFLATSIN